MKLLVPAVLMGLICGIIIFAFRRPKEKTGLADEDQTEGDEDTNHEITISEVPYLVNGQTSLGLLSFPNKPEKKCPVVIVVPEWWGLTDFTKKQAIRLAKQGYGAFVVDLYGNGVIASNPEEARHLSDGFYKNPKLAALNINQAITLSRTLSVADESKAAVIGYCFGGSMALSFANLGNKVDGVVSFHSGLKIVPPGNGMSAAVLVCHGDNDIFVPAETVRNFKKQMDDAGVNYRFISYPGATHSFTNPDATEMGKRFSIPIEYNEEAAQTSWNDMITFFNQIFH